MTHGPIRCLVCGRHRELEAFMIAGLWVSVICMGCRRTNPKGVSHLQQVLRRRRRGEWTRRARAALTRLARGLAEKAKGDVMPEEFAVRLRRLPERVAAIVGKTYAVRGDAFELADDEAVAMIRDLLLEIDDRIIDRNRNRRLAYQRQRQP